MKKIYLTILILLMASIMSAQNLRTGYFLDGYTYRYQFNPAFQGERGFVSLPGISRLGFGAETGLGLKDLLYPTSSGTLVTFLHPDLPDNIVMKNLGKSSLADANVDINMLGFGFRTKKSYHTFDISVRGNAALSIPGDVFRFMKVGASDENAVYDLSSLSFSSDAYAQASYGFSRRFFDRFNAGIRIKGLLGLESIRTGINDFSLALSEDKWMVNANGKISATELPVKLMENGEIETEDLLDVLKSRNFGFAVDLGVSVDVCRYLTLSASVLDLGAVRWSKVKTMMLENEPWVYEGFNISADQGTSNDFNSMLDSKLSELESLFRFSEMSSSAGTAAKHKLAMTIHAGAEITMPFYERISAGLLATHKINGPHTWTEGRFTLNWALLRCFSLAAGYAISNLGESYGAVINFHPQGFSFFLGTDSFRPFTLWTADGRLPINELNTNVVVGINFPFGKYHGRFPKKERKAKEDETD